jgi:hypothetical protein
MKKKSTIFLFANFAGAKQIHMLQTNVIHDILQTWEEAAGNACIVFLIAFRARQSLLAASRVGVNAPAHLQWRC